MPFLTDVGARSGDLSYNYEEINMTNMRSDDTLGHYSLARGPIHDEASFINKPITKRISEVRQQGQIQDFKRGRTREGGEGLHHEVMQYVL